MWLPDGPWIDRATGECFAGPRWVTVAAALDRVPQFVRPGSVLPLAVDARRTTEPDLLTLSVFPGTGTGRVYDDGDGPDGRWTDVAVSSADPAALTVRVTPGRPRDVVVRVEQVNRPVEVRIDGHQVDDWWFADATLHVPARLDAAPVTVEIAADGPLSRLGSAHNAQVRAADLARLAPSGGLLEVLQPGTQAHALAVARSGGPSVQVIEHTAPDEATQTLGQVIVAAPETGSATATVRWEIETGAGREEVEGKPTVVEGQALVVDAPTPWDGSGQPTRWRVEVRVSWDGVEVVREHDSAVLNPAITSWLVAAEPQAPEPEQWALHRLEPADIDFGNLVDRFIVRFRAWGQDAPPDAIGWARTTRDRPGRPGGGDRLRHRGTDAVLGGRAARGGRRHRAEADQVPHGRTAAPAHGGVRTVRGPPRDPGGLRPARERDHQLVRDGLAHHCRRRTDARRGRRGSYSQPLCLNAAYSAPARSSISATAKG